MHMIVNTDTEHISDKLYRIDYSPLHYIFINSDYALKFSHPVKDAHVYLVTLYTPNETIALIMVH